MSAVTRGDVTASLINLVRKDARRKSRRKAFGKLVGALIIGILHAAANGWYLMLAVGIVHHEWIRSCPTIGYGWAVLLAVLVRSALTYPSAMKSEADR